MDAIDKYNINLLGVDEQQRRLEKVKEQMRAAGISHALVRNNVNIYYLTGRVFRGFIYVSTDIEAPYYFVREPNHLVSDHHAPDSHIRKPEEIPALLAAKGLKNDSPIGLELDTITYSEARRLAACFGKEPSANISPCLRGARTVKTAAEIEKLRCDGKKQSLVYERIPHCFREGMTDVEFQIEIERASRLEGCLGQFRVAGSDMELFMGNVLTGHNADTPSPYDFAMGGEGLDASLPVGACGEIIRENMPVMVDVNGNYNGYMTDMTRMYIQGEPSENALQVLALSSDICRTLAGMMRPGAKACDLYNKAAQMAADAGMADFFMGHRSHAGFVGHGVGIEVNELPVIAPRSRDILAAGNVIALEPKFVVPGLGAIGIENTYVVAAEGEPEVLTKASEQFIRLD
ncbi:MAG: Xaa-Pro peptidase family protein [Muribaculaceae bacterium]|jgi:Xaa-Pro aminopeptidase|nr:Xaa-Pro peptidase family protein [Muribaculaceae bacterium]